MMIYKLVPLITVRILVIFFMLGILNTASAQFSFSTSSSFSTSASSSESFRNSVLDSEESSKLYSTTISKGLIARSEYSQMIAIFLYPLTLGFSGTVLYEAIQYDNDNLGYSMSKIPITVPVKHYFSGFSWLVFDKVFSNTIYSFLLHGSLNISDAREEMYAIPTGRVDFENAIFEAIFHLRNTDATINKPPLTDEIGTLVTEKEVSNGPYNSCSEIGAPCRNLETDCKTLFKTDEESPSQRQLAYVERDEVIVLGKNADQIKVTNKVQSISKWISIMDSDQVRYCQLANKYRDYELLSKELLQRSLRISKFLHEFADKSWGNSYDYSNSFSALIRKESSIEFTYYDKKYSYVHPAGKEQNVLEGLLERINSFFSF